jgi:hypothetical protein
MAREVSAFVLYKFKLDLLEQGVGMDSLDVMMACLGMHCCRIHSDEGEHWHLAVTDLSEKLKLEHS